MTKMNVSTWVLCTLMPMDQQFSVYSHIPEQRHVKRSYDGTALNERVRREALRNAALVVGYYQVGDIVSCCREARAGEHGLFVKDRNSLRETQPRTCWVICDSVPVGVAVDRLRLCKSAELLVSTTRKPRVHHFMLQTSRHNKASSMNVLRSIRQLLIHHEMPMKARTKMSKTMKCRRKHN